MPSVLSTLYGAATGSGTANEQTAFNRDLQEGDDSQVQGNALQGTGGALQGQFGNEYLNQSGLESGYRGEADTAYGDLASNPGYSATDAAAIQGNPNAGFQYYNPNQLEGDTSNYATGINTAAEQGQQYLQAAPTNQTNWQGGINSNLQGSGNEAVSGLEGGLGSAVTGYGTNLNGYQLSPEEAQNIKNVAAQATAGQYGKMSQQAQLTAAAQGNTSPAALAAIQENIGRQGAIDAGNAASSAELAANQTAADRQLTAATDIYGAQSNAANQIYGAQQGTAANLANTETQANESIAGTQGAAANEEANLGYNAAQTGGAQKIATDTGVQATGQGLATGADTAASNRATTTANQTIAGQNTYRNYLTGQQGAAQTAQQNAGNQQLSAYGGTTSAYTGQQGAINNANASAGNVAVGANSTGQVSFLADGGTVTGPTVGGYDESTLPKLHASDTPDIFRDYREQINPGSAGGGSPSTSPNVSIGGSSGGGGGYSGADPTSGDAPYDPYNNDYSGSWNGGDYGTGSGSGTNDGTVESTDSTITYDTGGDGNIQQNAIDALGSGYQPNYGDGGAESSGTPATVGERGPEAVISKPSRYAALGRGAVNALNALSGVLTGGRMQHPIDQPAASAPTTPQQPTPQAPQQPTPQAPQQPTPQAPQSLSSKIANGVSQVLTGRRYFADGGNVADPGQTSLMQAMSTPNPGQQTSSMRGDGSSVPGNEPGGAQGEYGWQGPASRNLAAGSPYRQPQSSMQVFNRPTNVMLGTNGSTDTVVPLDPGPNAKVTPSQMGIGQPGSPYGSQMRQSQAPQAAQRQAPMPSRYRPATGPKGMVGPQMRPMQSTARQGQYAAQGQ